MKHLRSPGPPLVALALFAFLPLQAQETDTLSQVSGQSLEEVIQGLPGQPVTLEELVHVALDRSLELESARLTRRLAEADVDRFGGEFDPSFRLSGSFSTDPLNPDLEARRYSAGFAKTLGLGTELELDLIADRSEALTDITGFPVTHDTDLALSFRQPLLDGLNTRGADFRVARAFRDAARHRFGRSRERVVARIENLYWALAEAEAVEAVRLRSFEIARALAFRNRQLLDRDLVARVDLLTARSGVELRRANLVEARRRRRDASEALIFAAYGEDAPRRLAQDSLPMKTVDVDLELPTATDVDRVAARALEGRLDVRAALQELEGARIREGAASNALLPELTLDGSLRTAGRAGSVETAFDELPEDVSWSVGLTFSAPLGNRTDRGLHLGARTREELRTVDLTLSRNDVRQDLRRAARAVVFGQERSEAASRSAELAAAQLDAERQRLELGLGDSFRLLQIEENAVQADLLSVRARFDLARAVTDYALATGEVDQRYMSGR